MFLTPPRVEAKSIPEQKVRSGKKGRRGWGYAENSARRVTVGVCPGQGTGGFEIALAELADSHRSPTLFPFIWLQGIRIHDFSRVAFFFPTDPALYDSVVGKKRVEVGGDGPGYRACKKIPGSPVSRATCEFLLSKGARRRNWVPVERDGTYVITLAVCKSGA